MPHPRLAGVMLFCCIMFLSLFVPARIVVRAQETPLTDNDRNALEQQLFKLQKEAETLDQTLQYVRGEKRTLSHELTSLNTEVKRREIEIKRLSIILNNTELQIGKKGSAISQLFAKIEGSKQSLGASLRLLYTAGEENTFSILLKNDTLSDFFSMLHNLARVQTGIHEALAEFRDDQKTIAQEKEKLEEFEEDQEGLKSLKEVERRFLAQKKNEKDSILRLTKGKEATFQELLQSKQKNIAAIKSQLFYLEKTGVDAEQAVRLATLAAERAGIRPAFLLALLEVETGKQFEDGVISVGTNLGTGNWKRDLYDCYISLGKKGAAESEKNAFFAITEKLGLNPSAMPVSRKPNYGCGGAMGAAQFLPTTWLRFESKVASLTGHNPPSPWNHEDAFTAAAIFLSQTGASSQTANGELRAARTYISGSATCSKSICQYYSNRILALSKEIDRAL